MQKVLGGLLLLRLEKIKLTYLKRRNYFVAVSSTDFRLTTSKKLHFRHIIEKTEYNFREKHLALQPAFTLKMF